MNNRLKVLITILVLVVMPVVSAYVVAKLFLEGKGGILVIIFIVLIVLSIILSIHRLIKSRKKDGDE